MLFVRRLLIFIIFNFIVSCSDQSKLYYLGNRCPKITDIYYYPSNIYNEEYFEKTFPCPYTLTKLEVNLPTHFINRARYNHYKKEYNDLGLPFPYPKKD